MLLKPAAALPRGEHWLYELKFDGFRGLALKEGESVRLFSRNGRDLTKRFGPIVDAIRKLRAKSAIIDGEIVCLDDNGRPCFEDLQNFDSDLKGRLFFYAFDLLCLNDKTLIREPLRNRKNLLRKLLPKSGPLRLSDFVDAEPEALVQFARENRLEGIVAQRAGSAHEPGKRSGAWTKFKTYQQAAFLVGGFLPAPAGIEALALGFWRDGVFRYSGRQSLLEGKQAAGIVSRYFQAETFFLSIRAHSHQESRRHLERGPHA